MDIMVTLNNINSGMLQQEIINVDTTGKIVSNSKSDVQYTKMKEYNRKTQKTKSSKTKNSIIWIILTVLLLLGVAY